MRIPAAVFFWLLLLSIFALYYVLVVKVIIALRLVPDATHPILRPTLGGGSIDKEQSPNREALISFSGNLTCRAGHAWEPSS
jgi:hypothetical protein